MLNVHRNMFKKTNSILLLLSAFAMISQAYAGGDQHYATVSHEFLIGLFIMLLVGVFAPFAIMCCLSKKTN